MLYKVLLLFNHTSSAALSLRVNKRYNSSIFTVMARLFRYNLLENVCSLLNGSLVYSETNLHFLQLFICIIKRLSTEFSKKSQLATPIVTRNKDVYYVIYSMSQEMYRFYDVTFFRFQSIIRSLYYL